MAARRLLVVMLILLGLSTLAAALIPPKSLRNATTTSTTASAPTETTPTVTAPAPVLGRQFTRELVVGGKQVPVVACPTGADAKKGCEPIRAGDQLSLVVYSRKAEELEIPAFGLVRVATPDAPALFDLLPESKGNYAINFVDTARHPDPLAAQIQVEPRGKAKATSRARAG
jgi:hypothetical protein